MRTSGILMPLFSLPSPYGIGTMGKAAYDFVDFLKKAEQTIWQMLPVSPTSYGDSPYQSYSAFAGNPYFIDLELLEKDGLLKKSEYVNEEYGIVSISVDYGLLYKNRYRVLYKAYKRFIKNIPDDFEQFCNDNAFWLDDFARYTAIKEANGGKPWYEWEKGLVSRDGSEKDKKYDDGVMFHKVIQYLFSKQWNKLRKYANDNGIKIMGDMPIYVALDSADVWANPKQFELNDKLLPIEVAGCPPDAFSKDGQLWGNPLYDWEYMESDGYSFWAERMKHTLKLYDIIRIDHFRGFESYYAIAYGEKTAKCGRWRKGPGSSLFKALTEKLGELPIVAEDLGYLTDGVREMLKDCGYPGMKVLQFAFDSREDSDYLPHNYDKNCVVYTGTHDNDTLTGWLETAPEDDIEMAKEYIRYTAEEGFCAGMIKTAMASVADTVIIPLQDYIQVGSGARINTPSTTGNNWRWRAGQSDVTDELAKRISKIVRLYRRTDIKKKNKED